MLRKWRNWNNFKRTPGASYTDEHDDRERRPNNSKRRVSFKPAGGGRDRGPNKGRMEIAIKAQLEDDEEMSDFGASKFRNDKNRRKGSPMPSATSRKLGQKKLVPGTFGWYQVTIPYGQKYEKELIIRNILNAISPDIFIPHYWKQDKTCVTFYLDDKKTAENLLNIDKTIQMPDGFRLHIRVRSGVPVVVVDDNLKEKMKRAMSQRYNVTTKALDLSKFHADPNLKDVFCGLFRPSIMLTAIDIIAANIPDLEAINLSENQISQLDHFKCLKEKLPRIQILHLADNKIQNVGALQAFKGLSIVELVLKDNPVRQRYREESVYISEIRRKFPKLRKLDGKDLEPQIVFDVGELTTLPTPKASFLCHNSGGDIMRRFLELYFTIFDSNSRLPLLEAYHEHAMLSVTSPPASQAGRLSSYWQYNRNLLRIHDLEVKLRLIRYGRLPAVSLLSELPKTQHDPDSFSADLTLFSPQLISFTVAGVFKELTSSECTTPEIKSFQRFFVIVPNGSGFCIRNEMIFITNPTPAQLKAAFKRVAAPAPAPAPGPATVTVSTPVEPVPSTSQGITASAPIIPDEATRFQMIQAMASHSNMNLEWSRKCLEETNWDFTRATHVFAQLQSKNSIPPEAFVK